MKCGLPVVRDVLYPTWRASLLAALCDAVTSKQRLAGHRHEAERLAAAAGDADEIVMALAGPAERSAVASPAGASSPAAEEMMASEIAAMHDCQRH